ncbi:1-(5-phosphoribosyl)-5-[(5-phosphoribosylamino)methylideneamino]imidazole-4-carboxamide isomerase [Lewinella sp. 4G2]|uniref:1-(5-phosphoribosyl)-5-[(5- phosphoribosylamino)methylideneamino]imidazole-4- carboxamide isomerase n=1 Tax=Lewinella sp. 4G2 TaxID=1803372 RepID=UPI0007B47CC5|nr:1-(5-phosphoribosyl)-5-[(5-phosphoribosylamino)methylideneamino]imidazole-4-carboxamide isomerase [Lewinella sp. 4G2]OAV43196.1 1-(5-phosphoribosyl)-5-[(5-phosphoribosylamino)methylideneamino]imidazole-4-carboxamide isomerase [Lewinella sp. 4G2]
MYIIPAIDLIDGKCVRLSQGDYSRKTVYNEDPLAQAKEFEAAGLTKIHVVDLDGARGGGIVNHKVLERIAGHTNLEIDWGGGMKSDEDLRIAFASGAHQVTGGTIAVKDPDVFMGWIERYGPEKIILGSDAKNGKIAVSGWEESSDLGVYDFIRHYVEQGLRYTICTDVSKDGMLAGTSEAMYRQIIAENPRVNLIASGGVATTADLDAVQSLGCYGVIVGKAFYEGRISLEELVGYQE